MLLGGAACASWRRCGVGLATYRRLFVLLWREGETAGLNRIYRLYLEEGLSVHIQNSV